MELPVQVVVLGKGDSQYEEFFRWAQGQYPGRVGVRLDYSESLAIAIYGGADLFLMPSKSEPCGLSQMIAMEPDEPAQCGPLRDLRRRPLRGRVRRSNLARTP